MYITETKAQISGVQIATAYVAFRILLALLDVRPTGNQGVAGSTRAGSATFFRRDLIMKYFLRSFSPEGQLSVSGERMYTILVNRLD